MMELEQIAYRYDATGYMLTYKGRPIGGVGTKQPSKHWRHVRADLKMYRQAAEREVSALKRGAGQARFRRAIQIIDA